MKSTIMLLALSIYNTVILAQQADDQNTYHENDRTYLYDIPNAGSHGAPEFDEQPRYLKLIAPVENERLIRAIKADFDIQGHLIKMT